MVLVYHDFYRRNTKILKVVDNNVKTIPVAVVMTAYMKLRAVSVSKIVLKYMTLRDCNITK